MKKGLRFTVYGLLLLTLVGCKSLKQTVEVPVYVHDTAYLAKEVHDSTYIDRWHTIEVKGDTVFDTKTITITKTLTRTDTAYKVVERPITVTQTETVEVEKSLRWWQKGLMWIGVVGLMGLMGLIGWRILKRRLK